MTVFGQYKISQYVTDHLGQLIPHPSRVGKPSTSLAAWGYDGVYSLVSGGRFDPIIASDTP